MNLGKLPSTHERGVLLSSDRWRGRGLFFDGLVLIAFGVAVGILALTSDHTVHAPLYTIASGAAGLDGYIGTFGTDLTGKSIEDQRLAIPSHSRRPGDFTFPRWKRNFIRQNRDFYEQNSTWLDPWLHRAKPWTLPSSFQKFEWNAQGGQRQIDDYVLQARASGLRVKRTTTAPSLIAMTHTQVPILGRNIAGVRRYMTPAECARLQSLSAPGFSLPDFDLHAYKALGNAVNAKVVGEIAGSLLADLTKHDATGAAA